MARIFQTSKQQTGTASKSLKIPFRPRQPKSNTTQISSPTQDPVSISGLRFCLHMVAFAAPGVILSKKLCDGERLEDIAQNAQDTLSALTNNPA
ncbi:hypothetical protein BGX20_002420 [Mortierella sp. AD010]|nr:hypothetical protein BGX20_002420 [Mortierella sp. AD010]